jgi:hypothetical protein
MHNMEILSALATAVRHGVFSFTRTSDTCHKVAVCASSIVREAQHLTNSSNALVGLMHVGRAARRLIAMNTLDVVVSHSFLETTRTVASECENQLRLWEGRE